MSHDVGRRPARSDPVSRVARYFLDFPATRSPNIRPDGMTAKMNGDLVGNSHEKRVSSDSVEGEEVVVRELDGGS
jgi:hypothetical protein